jgi:hypothetical protein
MPQFVQTESPKRTRSMLAELPDFIIIRVGVPSLSGRLFHKPYDSPIQYERTRGAMDSC